MLQLNKRKNQEELPAQNFPELTDLSTLSILYTLIAISTDSRKIASNKNADDTKNTSMPLFSKKIWFSRTFSTSDLHIFGRKTNSFQLMIQ